MVTGKPSESDSIRWAWNRFGEFELAHWYAVTRLREQVFVVEQNCPYQDADGLDPRAWHLCGWLGNDLAAYLRLLPSELADHPDIPALDGREVVAIGRVVVAPASRGVQLGRVLMQRGIAGAQERYPGRVIQVSAQAHLRDFYESLDFVPATAEYLEDDIPHLGMHLMP